jgi:uncharacterized membrane protein
MTETIFDFLHTIGFKHPLHPALTHIPMGMVMGAVTFRLVSLIPKFKRFAITGYHCVILAILGIAPTVVSGVLDWQHAFNGQWNFLIILKMILAAALTIVLLIIAMKDDPDNPKINNKTFLYLFCVLMVIGLGYCGGELELQFG